jgi:ankyrin repeat protein
MKLTAEIHCRRSWNRFLDRPSSSEGSMMKTAHSVLFAGLAAAALAACQGSGTAPAKVAGRPLAETAMADVASRKAEPGQRLRDAAARGDTEAVRDLLARDAPVNAQDEQGNTALLLATAGAQGRLEIVRMTMSYGADLKSTNRYGGTALIPACERGHVETAKALIAAGIDVNHVNRLGWTCLLEAVLLSDGGPRHQLIVSELIAARADLDLPDAKGVTALAHASARGQAGIVRLLQAGGAR